MKRIAAFILSLCAMAFTLSAQESITVKVQNLVSLDEQFNVTFVMEGKNSPSEFSWAPGDDFQLVWGPQRGSSTSTSWVNGKTTRSSQTTYTYILMPKRSGSFSLPEATAVVNGKTIRSNRVTVEVVTNGRSSSSQPSQPQQSQQSSSSADNVAGEDLYMRLILSKSSVMVGETVSATLKLYQRVNIAGFEDAKFPSFNGFWSQEVQAPANIEFHRETVGELIYNVAVLRSWNLVAQQAGEVRIDPAELVCLVNIRNRSNSMGSIFDSFFQDEYQTIRKRISTRPVTVKVSPLPQGAPASFHGGVGKYDMSVSLTRDSLKTHDAASLKVTVTGSGNTTLLEAPSIVLPPDFEKYDVKVSDVSGGKCFEFPFIPRSAGDFIIEPVEYTYFDISSRKYVTLRGKALPVKVSKGQESEHESGPTIVPGVSRSDVRNLGSDIRFISKEAGNLVSPGSFFIGSLLYVLLLVLLIAVALVVYLATRAVGARRADVVGSRNRSASKMARKRLSKAGTYLSENLYTAFYEELHRALLGFISDKFNMDASEMSKENIQSRLVSANVPESVAAEFISLLDACEYARYAPSEGHEAMNAHYESAVNVISSIDSRMKRKNRVTVVTAMLLLMILPGSLRAEEKNVCDSLWQAGIAAYSSEDWSSASSLWNEIAAGGMESAELYYNLGNAEFKAGNVAKAVLCYERSLKLDPSYSNARYNLEFAQSQVKDKIEEIPEFFLKAMVRKIGWQLSSDAWAVISVLLFALLLASILIFLLGQSVVWRKTGFIVAIVALLSFSASMAFSLWQKNEYFKADSGIVMTPVVSVKSAPGNSQDLFILHEGTKVTLIDEVGEWCNIELADGRQGWMKSSDIEII